MPPQSHDRSKGTDATPRSSSSRVGRKVDGNVFPLHGRSLWPAVYGWHRAARQRTVHRRSPQCHAARRIGLPGGSSIASIAIAATHGGCLPDPSSIQEGSQALFPDSSDILSSQHPDHIAAATCRAGLHAAPGVFHLFQQGITICSEIVDAVILPHFGGQAKKRNRSPLSSTTTYPARPALLAHAPGNAASHGHLLLRAGRLFIRRTFHGRLDLPHCGRRPAGGKAGRRGTVEIDPLFIVACRCFCSTPGGGVAHFCRSMNVFTPLPAHARREGENTLYGAATSGNVMPRSGAPFSLASSTYALYGMDCCTRRAGIKERDLLGVCLLETYYLHRRRCPVLLPLWCGRCTPGWCLPFYYHERPGGRVRNHTDVHLR